LGIPGDLDENLMSLERSLRHSAAILAWSLAAAILFVTWCPQGMRPHLGNPDLERFGAFFLTSTMFVLAYPRRAALIAFGAVAFAVVLELGQFLAPGRDPGVRDVIAKAFGGISGVLVAFVALQVGSAFLRPRS
jgi:hypothetical protein